VRNIGFAVNFSLSSSEMFLENRLIFHKVRANCKWDVFETHLSLTNR